MEGQFPSTSGQGKDPESLAHYSSNKPSYFVPLQMTVESLVSCWLRYAAQTSISNPT